MRYAIALFCLGCAPTQVIVLPDAGDGGVISDAGGSRPDAAVSPEPEPGGECDQQDNCQACSICSQAPFRQCNSLALGCDDSPDCGAMIACVNACGSDRDCLQGCARSHPDGATTVSAIYACMICDACPADCRQYELLWCHDAPF